MSEWFARFEQHDRQALSRILSFIAQGKHPPELIDFLAKPSDQPVRVIAFTGSGGVGKSSLVGQLLELARREGKKVAILACDPESPISGGALLGDRFRMNAGADDGVFIRSLAAASGQGALAEHLELMIGALRRFGFDLIFLETVGAGQSDVAVRVLADVVVLLVQPEAGDDLQWEKAGVFEVADVIVVHKADLPGAEKTAAQVRASLDLSKQSQVLVFRVSSYKREGLGDLWQHLLNKPPRSGSQGLYHKMRGQLETFVRNRLQALWRQPDTEFQALLESWRRSDLPDERILRKVLVRLAGRSE